MIEWMQKHNKYLVVTIWIATIAFIGAGFVGWGSYHYGKKATAIAEVGDVEISQDKFDFTYRTLYRKYNQLFQGNFDNEKAKQMQLSKQVFSQLVSQALLLNLANEYGIRVSDSELANYIASLPAFMNNGSFDKRIYQTFLENSAISARSFEKILKDDIKIEKLMSLLDKRSLKYEQEVVGSALAIEDKISYSVILPSDVKIDTTDEKLKSYWEAHKSRYMTPKKYKLAIVWTDLENIKIDEKELKDFYNRNSYNYLDGSGKELPFDKVKDKVVNDYKLKKGKREALKDYIAFKKGKKASDEVVELNVNDPKLSKEIWSQIIQSDSGKIVKPKAVANRYATVKVEGVIEPKQMSFEEAKRGVLNDYKKVALTKALDKEAQKYLNGNKKFAETTDFIKSSKPDIIKGLTTQESLQFFKKLFTSNEQIGMISLLNKRVVYEIKAQKLAVDDDNTTQKELSNITDKIKSSDLGDNLMRELSKKYKIKKFVKGI